MTSMSHLELTVRERGPEPRVPMRFGVLKTVIDGASLERVEHLAGAVVGRRAGSRVDHDHAHVRRREAPGLQPVVLTLAEQARNKHKYGLPRHAGTQRPLQCGVYWQLFENDSKKIRPKLFGTSYFPLWFARAFI